MLPNWGEIVWREALTVNSGRTFSEESLIILIMLAFHGACRIAAPARWVRPYRAIFFEVLCATASLISGELIFRSLANISHSGWLKSTISPAEYSYR